MIQKLPLPARCALFLLIGLGVGGCTMSFVQERRRAAHDVIVTIQDVPITAPEFYRKLEARTGRDAIAKLAADALALKFAESLGAIPPAAAVEAKVRLQQHIPGWSDFASKHNLTTDDVHQICRLQLARELAVRACNAAADRNTGGSSVGSDAPLTNTPTQPSGARYVERFAQFRKSAKTEVFSKQYVAEISGHGP